MADLADSEVHVVYSARDLARQVPAAWQESIKQGRSWSYRPLPRPVSSSGRPGSPAPSTCPTVLGTWGAGLPAGARPRA